MNLMRVMDITIIREKISNTTLRSYLNNPFPEMVKFVVDIEKKVIALGGEMHADAEQVLLADGSEQRNLWGGNIYPDEPSDTLEYSSLINIRPSQNNRAMEVQDEGIRSRIQAIVRQLVAL